MSKEDKIKEVCLQYLVITDILPRDSYTLEEKASELASLIYQAISVEPKATNLTDFQRDELSGKFNAKPKPDICIVCQQKIKQINGSGTVMEQGDKLYIVTIFDIPCLLHKGDRLCSSCYQNGIWYRRMEK